MCMGQTSNGECLTVASLADVVIADLLFADSRVCVCLCLCVSVCVCCSRLQVYPRVCGCAPSRQQGRNRPVRV
jgi:hypothetical protein